MKQKCQIQMGVGQYKNAATLFRTRGIDTTHQHFQMRYITLIYLKGLKSYQPKNFKCVVLIPLVLNGVAAFLYCPTPI